MASFLAITTWLASPILFCISLFEKGGSGVAVSSQGTPSGDQDAIFYILFLLPLDLCLDESVDNLKLRN